MTETAAAALFASLNTYQAVAQLILDGEAEGQFLECKAPQSPALDKGLKAQLSVAASGFANSGGGVLLWGMSTDAHKHSGLDILTQIQPIGNVRAFAQRVDRALATLVTPTLTPPPSRVLTAAPGDTKGVVLTLVPPSIGDPIQALDDRRFYIRVGAEFVEMPYATLKRMFAGAEAPLLVPKFDDRLVRVDPDGTWHIPIVVTNLSSFAATGLTAIVEAHNFADCESIIAEQFNDASAINPGQRLFICEPPKPVYRGLDLVAGTLHVRMKKVKRPKRMFRLTIALYAHMMRARQWTMTVQLAKKGFHVRKTAEKFLY